MVWLTICIEPPPTSFLNFTSEKSGSMPVVSQSIMKPMVPVGASTEACALRKPFFSPILITSAHASVASLLDLGVGDVDRAERVVGRLVLAHDPLVGVGVAGVAGVRADDARRSRPSGRTTCRSSAR